MPTENKISGTGVTLQAARASRGYVAGPMTGIKDFNYPAFNAVAEDLRAQGYEVENPADHGIVEGAVAMSGQVDVASAAPFSSIRFPG
jgi:hypothetical protein